MRKLLQLVFGDAETVASVALALLAAWAFAFWQPGAAGWVAGIVLLVSALWQAAR